MNTQQPRFQYEEQDNERQPAGSEPLAISPAGWRPARRSAWRRSDLWFLLAVLLFGLFTLVILPGGTTTQAKQGNVSQPRTVPAATASARPVATATNTTSPAFREYPFPQPNSQVMRLAVDHEGRVWFGEMGANYLAVFDPRTQTFQQMTPPEGHNGIMGIQVASDDTIWFAEQYANYIGHYIPATGRYQIYHLPTLTVPDPAHPGKTLTLPSAPNDLTIDAHGNIWFTELNAGAIGELNPRTGHFTYYPLGKTLPDQQLNPYGIAIDPQGMVWFTEISADHLGRLDPITGKIAYFTKPGDTQALMEIASGRDGTIWATSFSSNVLLRFDPRTGTFTTYHPTASQAVGMYGLVVSPAGGVWVTLLAENSLARLDVATGHFTYYTIPTPNSEPLALAMGADQTLWFTEVNNLGMMHVVA